MATYSVANERLRVLEELEREIGASLQSAGERDPGAVEGEADRAAARAPGRPVHRLRAEGGVGAVGPDPLPHPGGHGAAPRGLQLLGPQGLPDGAEPGRLRPGQAGGAGPHLRAHAGAI
ncbi:unnamed protein product, partial [Eretmochelys imbricata]